MAPDNCHNIIGLASDGEEECSSSGEDDYETFDENVNRMLEQGWLVDSSSPENEDDVSVYCLQALGKTQVPLVAKVVGVVPSRMREWRVNPGGICLVRTVDYKKRDRSGNYIIHTRRYSQFIATVRPCMRRYNGHGYRRYFNEYPVIVNFIRWDNTWLGVFRGSEYLELQLAEDCYGLFNDVLLIARLPPSVTVIVVDYIWSN